MVAYFSEIFPPAAKKVILAFEKSKVSRSITSCSLPLKLFFDQHFLDDATKNKLSIASFFFSRYFENFSAYIACGSYDCYIHDFVEDFILDEGQIANVSSHKVLPFISALTPGRLPNKVF